MSQDLVDGFQVPATGSDPESGMKTLHHLYVLDLSNDGHLLLRATAIVWFGNSQLPSSQ